MHARNAVARSRREVDTARAANVPLQDDLRRVNALLVAHAEEHQRDVTRVRDLEASSSAAETARVTAQAARDDAQALLLPATSRADAFRVALVSSRRAASQRRVQAQDRERRLQARLVSLEIARLERLIDDSDRAYTERTLMWRRLLREARIGREERDALVGRLRNMVLAVGGSLDVTALVRQLEGRVEAAVHAAIPLPPDLDPE
ncbi:hypothetical protein PHMEG_00032872, partial [Phytophthora megakarya]